MSSPEQDFVFAGGKVYPVEALHAAMHTATLDRLESALPQGASPRRAMMAIRALKTPEAHRAVMNRALALLAESGEDVPLSHTGGALPIAAFPKRIDNPNKTG